MAPVLGIEIQDSVWSTLVLIGGIGLMILIGFIAVMVVFVAAQAKERRDADKVLALRLAKGEITEAEYERLFLLLRFGPQLSELPAEEPPIPAESLTQTATPPRSGEA